MNDELVFSARLAEANAASPFREDATPEALEFVGQSRMLDADREEAIFRAGRLVEFFQAERDLYEALYLRTSCLSHKGAADGAKVNWRKAVDLLAALLAGRRG